MRTFEYDLSDTELVEAYTKACAQSAVANSGLCVDMMAPMFAKEAHYLKGVLYARLAKEKPPVRPGAMVYFKNPSIIQFFRRVDSRQGFVVERVIYVGHDPFAVKLKEKWHVTLKDIDIATYPTFLFTDLEIMASDHTIAIAQPTS